MRIDFVPNICKGDGAKYSGKLVIEVPKAAERHNYIRKSGVLAIAEKTTGPQGEKESTAFDLASQYEVMTNMLVFIEKHIVGVDLKRIEDGAEIKTLDVLLSTASLEPALMELATLFIQGFEPGKN